MLPGTATSFMSLMSVMPGQDRLNPVNVINVVDLGRVVRGQLMSLMSVIAGSGPGTGRRKCCTLLNVENGVKGGTSLTDYHRLASYDRSD